MKSLRASVFIIPLAIGASAQLVADEWLVPAEASATANPIPSTPDALGNGSAIYHQSCMVCHGAEGNGDGQGATFLVPKPASFADPAFAKQADGAIFWKITTGRNAMPVFKTLLTDTQRWQLVDFLRTFSPGAATKGATQK
jgi:mono/diheme cytochrome c family protein